MSTIEKDMLFIKSRTTGFASPAESYVDKRLDVNELIATNPLTTFYFRYKGPDTLGVKNGNILVIDKSVDPVEDDLVVLADTSCFKIRKFEGQSNVWGKVSWILNKL